MIKTFSGLLADGAQDKIHLAGGDSTKGYKINKFQLLPYDIMTEDYEGVATIHKTSQASAPAVVNFNDDSLLGAGYWNSSSSSNIYPDDLTVTFETEIFNQDIFINWEDTKSNSGMNYYLELEEVTMSDAEAANVNFVAALVHT